MTQPPTAPPENRVPGLGQTVLYTLTSHDAQAITERRQRAEPAAAEPPHLTGPVGADVHEGDLYPAVVVRVRSLDPDAEINLQVLLDGEDRHWARHVTEGVGPGTWSWPDM